MNLFKKKNAEEKSAQAVTRPKKVKNSFLLKYGGFSTAVTAIVLAAVIVLNLLMGVLEDRGIGKFDMSSGGQNSISEENKTFLKGIDKKVTLTVLANRDSYASSLAQYAVQYYNIADNSDFYSQTLNLIDGYSEANKNIEVKFTDYTSAAAKTYAEEFPSMFYGDIIVSVTSDTGETKNRLVTFTDIYTYSDSTGYAAQGYSNYTVDGNNFETAVSSAINVLLSGKTKSLALLSAHSTASVFEQYYSETLHMNGFDISTIDDAFISSISSDIDTVAIVCPSTDFLPEEITVLNTWLDNGGQKGKSLIFIPGKTVNNIPNLLEFLQEWGISYESGTLYQTDKSYRAPTSKKPNGDPATTTGYPSKSDITEDVLSDTSGGCIIGDNRPMSAAYESFGSRTPYTVISTNDTVTVMPDGADDNWEPSKSAQTKSYANLLVTRETEIVDNEPHYSYVAAFSSYEFVYSAWAQYSNLLNMDAALNTAMYVSGMGTDSAITFVAKTITDESFADEVNASKSLAVNIIFIGIVPAAILAAGIVIFARRKRR